MPSAALWNYLCRPHLYLASCRSCNRNLSPTETQAQAQSQAKANVDAEQKSQEDVSLAKEWLSLEYTSIGDKWKGNATVRRGWVYVRCAALLCACVS